MWGFGGSSSSSSTPNEEKKSSNSGGLKKSNSSFSLGGYSILQGNPEPPTPKVNVASTSTARPTTSNTAASTAALNFLTLGQTKMSQRLPSVMSIFSRPAAPSAATPSPSPTTDRKGAQSDDDKSESAAAQHGSRRGSTTASLSLSSIGRRDTGLQGMYLTSGSESSLNLPAAASTSVPVVPSLKSATASTRMELSGALLPHPGTSNTSSDLGATMSDKTPFTTPRDAFTVFLPYSAPSKGPDKKYKYWLSDAKEMEEKGAFKDLENRQFIYLGGKDLKGRPIIVVVVKRLPDLRNLSEVKLHEILLFVVSRLHDQVTEEYIVVYCHTEAHPFNAKVLRWLSRVYGNLPRPYKKNLKHLYAINATAWVKSFFALLQPFVKQKFWKKLHYIEDLALLQKALPSFSLQMSLPLYVLFHADHYFPIYGSSLNMALTRCRKGVKIPTPVYVCGEYLKEKGMVVENLFKACASEVKVKEIVDNFDSYEEILFIQDVHAVATAFKRYLNELPDPLVPSDASQYLINQLAAASTDEAAPSSPQDKLPILQEFVDKIPMAQSIIFRYVLEVILEASHYEKMTKMSTAALAHVFGPILLLGKKGTILHISSEDSVSGDPCSPKFDSPKAAQALQLFLENAHRIAYPALERDRAPSAESVGSQHNEVLSSPQSIMTISDVDSDVWIDNELYNADDDGDGLYFDEFYMQCLPGPVKISVALDDEKSIFEDTVKETPRPS